MSGASGWIVVPAHREFPTTPQFVPAGSHAGFALARLGAILSAGGAIYASMEPLGGKRNQDNRRKFGASLLCWADAQEVKLEDDLRKEMHDGFPHADDAVASILAVPSCLLPAQKPLA